MICLTLDQNNSLYAERVLRLYGNNKTMAAKALGIDRRTLYRMVKKWKADPANYPEWRASVTQSHSSNYSAQGFGTSAQYDPNMADEARDETDRVYEDCGDEP